jgi:hypothetical protein
MATAVFFFQTPVQSLSDGDICASPISTDPVPSGMPDFFEQEHFNDRSIRLSIAHDHVVD